MSQAMVLIKVIIKDTREEITFMLSHDDAEKATKDEAFLRVLVAKEKERMSNITNVGSSQQFDTASSPLSEEGESSFSTNVTHNVSQGTDSEKSLFIWPSQCVFLLLGKYEEHIGDFSSGSKRHNKIWESIAAEMREIANYGISASQCQSKMNSLKKIYKKIIDHNNVSGNDRQSWLYFNRMDELFGKTGWARPSSTASEVEPSPSTSKDINEPPVKKAKADIVMEKFVEEMKISSAEKEKRREERKLAMFTEIKNQWERQHQEKLEVLKKLAEALTGKQIFD